LEEVDDPRATQPLLAALKDEDPTVRVSAIHALSRDADAGVTLNLLDLITANCRGFFSRVFAVKICNNCLACDILAGSY
jgi:HEAT repeat protein